MNIRVATYFLFIVYVTSFVACSNKNDESILPRDKMVNVLHDIQLSESMFQTKYNEFNNREQKDALVNYILKKHDITQAQLDSSLVWYSDNAEIYMRVNDSVISTLRSDIRLTENRNLSKNSGENYNNYIISNHVFLTANEPVVTFNIDSLLIKNYQNFEMTFTPLGLTAIDTTAEYSIIYTYLDTIVVDKNKILEDITYSSINPLPNDTLKSISGYIYMSPGSIQNRSLLINNIRIRNKQEDK